MSSNSILVTGGAGYIGSHVTRQLMEAGEKVVVLEQPQDAEVSSDAGGQEPLAPSWIAALLNSQADQVVEHRGEEDESQESPVPRPIEDIGGSQKEGLV